jgi:phospholipase/carboxylesterase
MPPRAGGPPRQLVVLLHGVGADGRDLIELAPTLAAALPRAAFVAPNAPEACDMAPFGYQWFSLRDRRPDALLLGVQAIAPVLDAFLDAELERHRLADHQLALVGFSQGAMAALYVAPRRPPPLAGVLGYSGALLGAERLPEEAQSRPPGPRRCRRGGSGPRHACRGGRTASGRHSGAVVAAPGLSHGIDPEGIVAGAAFLAAAFSESGA